MSTQFSINTGYRGVVKIGLNGYSSADIDSPTSENWVTLLATSGQFTQNHQPIFSTGIWGAGYYNIAEQVAYANDIIRLEGSMGCEYTAGRGFQAVQNFAFTNRGAKDGTSIMILPNAHDGFIGRGWCTSLSFAASQGAVLTGDMNFSSFLDGASNKIIADGYELPSDPGLPTLDDNGNVTSDTTTEGGAGWYAVGVHNLEDFDYNGLYPYWACNIHRKASETSEGEAVWDSVPISDIMSWNASYSSSMEMLKCCGTTDDAYTDGDSEYYSQMRKRGAIDAPLAPDYVGLGPMSAECSMEVFKLAGEFADAAFHDQNGFRFICRTPQSREYTYAIDVPIVVCSNNSSQIQTGTGWITASFSYTAIGDRKKPPMSLHAIEDSSDASGSGN